MINEYDLKALLKEYIFRVNVGPHVITTPKTASKYLLALNQELADCAKLETDNIIDNMMKQER